MSKTYRGDTLPKKIVRARVWERACSHLGSFSGARFLALAGPEGADVGCAVALGADPTKITLIDKNKAHADNSAWRWPDVNTLHGDVADVLEGHQYDFAFLDFCCQLTDKILTLAGLTITESVLPREGLVAITFQCGREQPDDPVYQRVLEEARGLPKENRAQVSRAIALRSELQKRVRRSHCTTIPIGFWFYQSHVGDGMLPMGVYLCRVMRSSRTVWDKANDLANKARPEYTFINEFTKGALVDEIYRFEDHDLDTSLMLNIPKGSIAAYKANVTRGTYEK